MTGEPNIKMQYKTYECNIVVRHGIELWGWTHSMWGNPSQLSTSLPPLQKLCDAPQSGDCKFVRLSRSEHKAHEVEYNQKLMVGEIAPRKIQKDSGKSCGKRVRK